MTARHVASAPSQRQLRVGEEIRHALIRIFAEAHWRDPDLVGANITLTEVRIGPDLRSATAFVLPFGGGDAATLATALNRAVPFLRRELGRAVRLRLLPELRFEADTSFDEAARIRDRLVDPTVRRDLESHDADDSTGNGSDAAPS